MLLATIFIISLITYFLVQYSNWRTVYNKVKNIPSPPSLPLLGHALLFTGAIEDVFDTFSKLRENFENIMAIWFGSLLTIVVCNPRYLETIMADKSKIKKGPAYEFLKPAIGENILTMSGPNYDRDKKIIMQTFQPRNVILSVDIFNGNCGRVIDLMSKKLDGGVFNADRYLTRYSMSNLLEAAMGISNDFLSEQELINLNHAIQKISEYSCERGLRVWLYPDFIFKFSSIKKKQDEQIKVIEKIAKKCIQQRKLIYEKNSDKVPSKKNYSIFLDGFFSHIKTNGEKFTEEEIKNEFLTVLLAGLETTVSTIGFTLCALGQHQEIQEKVGEELHNIFGDSDKSATYEDTLKMQYLNQVICEVWRLYPPINYIARTPLVDIPIDDYVIPKGCQIFVPLKYINLNSETFPNPEKFNPDNFLPEVVKQRHPYSYMPFSVGYRKCIGDKFATLSIKLFLSNFFRKFKVFSDKVGVQKDFKIVSMLPDGFQISITRI